MATALLWATLAAAASAPRGVVAHWGFDGSASDDAGLGNDVLFGGANLFAAKAVLTACVLVSVGLFLAMLELPKEATFIVVLGVLGALTAIGWAHGTMMLLAALLVILTFARKTSEYWSGKAPSGEE